MKVENKFYKQGKKAWHKNKSWKDNPYKHGTNRWQSWLNGWGDASDEVLLKLLKNS